MRRDFIFQIHITDSCQHDCDFCYIEKSRRESGRMMPLWRFIVAMVELRTLSCILSMLRLVWIKPIVHITGGDPLHHRNVNFMVRAARIMGIKVAILGNPQKYFPEFNALCDAGMGSYQVSLSRNFSSVLNFVNAAAHKGIKLYVNTIVDSINCGKVIDWFEELAPLLKNTGGGMSITRAIDTRNPVDPVAYMKSLEGIYRASKHDANAGALLMRDPLFSLVAYQAGDMTPGDKMHGGCEAASTMMGMDVDGTVTPCRKIIKKYNSHGGLIYGYFAAQGTDDFRRDSGSECGKCNIVSNCRGCLADTIYETHGFHIDRVCQYGGLGR